MTSACSSYYDIDSILAEEELIPVNNLLDFSHLAHLDPDYTHHNHTNHNNNNNNSMSKQNHQSHTLPENTRFKMPLWSISKWSTLNYIRLSLPKHYNRKGRQKLDADPSCIDLRQKNERFYMSGMTLIHLIHTIVQRFHQQQQSQQSNINANHPDVIWMNHLHKESQELKRTLLLTYTGERLRRTFDWTMSLIDDDVSSFTKKLTVMEETLFRCSAAASHAFAMWKLHGSRRIHVSETALRAGIVRNGTTNASVDESTSSSSSKRSFTTSNSIAPDENGSNNLNYSTGPGGSRNHDLQMSNKRIRSY